MKNGVFWDVVPYGSCKNDVSEELSEALSSSETSRIMPLPGIEPHCGYFQPTASQFPHLKQFPLPPHTVPQQVQCFQGYRAWTAAMALCEVQL
jgi:hypothetical protein